MQVRVCVRSREIERERKGERERCYLVKRNLHTVDRLWTLHTDMFTFISLFFLISPRFSPPLAFPPLFTAAVGG